MRPSDPPVRVIRRVRVYSFVLIFASPLFHRGTGEYDKFYELEKYSLYSGDWYYILKAIGNKHTFDIILSKTNQNAIDVRVFGAGVIEIKCILKESHELIATFRSTEELTNVLWVRRSLILQISGTEIISNLGICSDVSSIELCLDFFIIYTTESRLNHINPRKHPIELLLASCVSDLEKQLWLSEQPRIQYFLVSTTARDVFEVVQLVVQVSPTVIQVTSLCLDWHMIMFRELLYFPIYVILQVISQAMHDLITATI